MNQYNDDRYRHVLHKVVDAWEALPGGRNYHPRDIEAWLRQHMSPAIRHAREVLKRPTPKPERRE